MRRWALRTAAAAAGGALLCTGVLAAVAVRPDPPRDHDIEFVGNASVSPDLTGPLLAALGVAVLAAVEIALAAIQVRDLVRDVRERRAKRARR